MSDAVKVYLAGRGLDVKDYVMFAFGGGGPMHAAAYGEISGVKKTYLVANAGVFSAFGIALADTKHRQQVTLLDREPLDHDKIVRSFEDLDSRLLADFEREGLSASKMQKRYFMDLRYQGQFHELTIEIPNPESLDRNAQALREQFEHHYEAVYGAAPSVYSKLELVGLGVEGVAETPKPSLQQSQPSDQSAMPINQRQACFDAAEGYRAVPVFAHRDLLAMQRIPGPAFVEDDYLTMIVLPKQVGIVDNFGNIVIHHDRERFVHAS
jgi:N-methylhydantoinase A